MMESSHNNTMVENEFHLQKNIFATSKLKVSLFTTVFVALFRGQNLPKFLRLMILFWKERHRIYSMAFADAAYLNYICYLFQGDFDFAKAYSSSFEETVIPQGGQPCSRFQWGTRLLEQFSEGGK